MNAKRNHRIVGAGIAALVISASVVPTAKGQAAEQREAKQPVEQPAQPRALPPAPAPTLLPASGPALGAEAKQRCSQLLQSARAALARGDLAQAEKLAAQATALRLPEAGFTAKEDSPARLAWDLQMARYRRDAGVVPALGHTVGATNQALHVGELDTTKNVPVGYEAPGYGLPAGEPRLAQAPSGGSGSASRPSGSAGELIEQGEQRLRTGDFNGALQLFQQADRSRNQLTPAQRGRLSSHLKMLAGSEPASPGAPVNAPELLADPVKAASPLPSSTRNNRSLLDDTQSAQQRLDRQLLADVGTKQLEAKRLRQDDPRGALKMLQDLRADVEKSQVSEQFRGTLIRRVDAAIAETDRYIEANRAQIELDEANAAVLAEVDRRRAANLKLQNRKAELVDEFNKLRDEQRYAEAELVAKRLYEMVGPHDELASQILLTAKFLRREILNREYKLNKEQGVFDALAGVDDSSIPLVGGKDSGDFRYDEERWRDFAGRRESLGKDNRLTPREVEIQRKLKTPVQVKFRNRSLSEVINSLANLTGINIHLDPRGLAQESVSSDTPVDIELTDQVMLKSALNLILEPLHLSYVIKDEVLKVTSQQLRDGETYHKVYYVADLVTPIPNFVPGSNFGLQGLINDAHRSIGFGGGGLTAPGPIIQVPERPGFADNGSPVSKNVLGQQGVGGGTGFGGGGGSGPLQFGGPPAGGGGADADFDSLIDLIVSTVASETWAENGGGEAEIRPYANNLSLVISQTQAVHEQIADLLEQLRRLQDLQITIEVRFITLSDDFFEQIGVDFNFNINDEVSNLIIDPVTGFETPARGAVVGASGPAGPGGLPGLTADLDVPFRQGSFAAASVLPIGAAATGAANFGFAILSDIEAFFLVSAAQGDTRTNLLDAPKVTLFNGQTAFIADTSQTPFVISVIPVVGEFAAAQQPVIVVLSEGTLMNIQAVVSEDRRYVRMTVVPFFSQIQDVDTFTFEGSTSTSSSSSTTDDDDDGTNESATGADDSVVAGTTVQLPTFAFISVATTVSVPDGGTVLLGGIKELDEGRNEFGVPLLSKLPYINRLFRNVGIARNTSSLMFMVTPRIIIQEEEEEKLGIAGT